jgi:hypothetical protein
MSLYGEQSLGFKYVNNVTVRNSNGYGIFGDAVGEGAIALTTYTPDAVVAGNVIVGAWATIYPANNFYPADLSNLASYKGTDGLVPGFMGVTSSPSPSPTPTPLPSPSPSPSATPAPSPSPTPTPLPSPSPSPAPRCVKFNPKGKCLKWN